MYMFINVNVHVYKCKCTCLWFRYPRRISRLYNLHPWYWNTLFYSLISSGENSAFAHFVAAIANHYILACSTRYPSLLGGQRWHDMRSLPNTSTHGCQCGHVLPLVSRVVIVPAHLCSAVPDVTCSLCHVHWRAPH